MNGRAISGLVICVLGIVFTFFVKTGFIWWGAIVFGAIRFFHGLSQGRGEGPR
jgi:hypothetical protein